jgi:O-glycosyl hydrolase
MSTSWYINGSENEGLVWARKIHNAIVNGNVSAYIYWIGAGSSRGEAPFIYLPKNDTSKYEIGGNFFAFTHWSRFIRPGAKRISLDQKIDAVSGVILASAYENIDGSMVVQAINDGDGDVALKLQLPPSTSSQQPQVLAWLTDNNQKVTAVPLQNQATGGSAFNGVAPGRSMVTFLIK